MKNAPKLSRKPETQTKKVAKRSYRRPEILSREPMEVVAAVCTYPGKANYASCPSGPISS